MVLLALSLALLFTEPFFRISFYHEDDFLFQMEYLGETNQEGLGIAGLTNSKLSVEGA
jgi:hypothetical protein